ncbi:MAG: hypothetical protein D6769_02645 [Methanobacteriota archaeon]|nr:MAG: hypothetical protein D6769_02645 [Euryarchaeota archaeon]
MAYIQYVSCSEIWTFASNKVWFLKKLLGIPPVYGKGIKRHEAVFSDSALNELEERERDNVLSVREMLKKIGDVEEERGFKKNESYSLMGKADGISNSIPIEVKFYRSSKADKLQAASYALLYGTDKAWLVTPYSVEEVYPSEHMAELMFTIDAIKSFKKISKEDILSLLEEVEKSKK